MNSGQKVERDPCPWDGFEARKRFKKGINISNALVIIIGFVGTLVWGYGDLIYKSIN